MKERLSSTNTALEECKGRRDRKRKKMLRGTNTEFPPLRDVQHRQEGLSRRHNWDVFAESWGH